MLVSGGIYLFLEKKAVYMTYNEFDSLVKEHLKKNVDCRIYDRFDNIINQPTWKLYQAIFVNYIRIDTYQFVEGLEIV